MPFTAAGGTLAAVLFVLTLPFVRFSTSWPRGGSPTPNGTVCLTSWPRWSEETLHSSATLRRDASPPSLSPLSTCGERMLLLLVLSFVAVLCGELFNQLFFFFPALQRKNQRGQSTENCWWAQRNWKCKKCFKILFQFLFFSPERPVHPDVRGALGRRCRLRLQAPGSDACFSQLPHVYGLTKAHSVALHHSDPRKEEFPV